MGIYDFVVNGARAMVIARPDAMKHLLVYKHPDQNIPMYAQLTVDQDEVAVFFKDGTQSGIVPPGRHTLQTQNLPFLTNFINTFTGGNLFIAEVFFVKTIMLPNVTFGGPIGMMRDPQLKCLVNPRIFGSMSIVISDPVAFVGRYHGQAAGGADNEYTLKWIKDLFMGGVKQSLGDFCIKQKISLIDALAYTKELGQSFIAQAPEMVTIGIRILQMGQFSINFSEDDDKKLNDANERFVSVVADEERDVQIAQIRVSKAAAEAQAKQFELDQKFGQDARYVQQLAGNYQNFAAGQAMMGAGQGMAEHGVGGGVAGMGAQMAIGVGMGNQMAGAFQQAPTPFAQAQPQFAPGGGGTVVCGKCQTRQPGGKFCAECGSPLAPQKKFCAGCAAELQATAKFCASCGQPTAVPPPAPAG
ncbi:MAG: SPFH domain-containing protein [Myxococcales bacterium]|jgi:membrane protease subunit (stomatin/prohibitin family)